ncbi:MAG: helix-turn-helix transcriptional regulator [Lachnospiraceae bacterium]|nr:helix-turn-helix transcriptional regulator [Lachnospiraceae bacterium]
MSLNALMQQKNISKYRLSKNSGIPYTTLTDILNGKARLEKCSAETVYKLARELNISMEELLAPCFMKRPQFDLFKSNVCHKVKELGDVPFIIELLETDDIQTYYERQWYPEAFYLLAMLDYLSRINQIPLCDEYSSLRRQKLSEPIYPSSIVAASLVADNDDVKREAFRSAIPEFLRFNIIESEVRNVV